MKFLRKIKELRHRFYIWKYCHTPIQDNKIIMWADGFKHFGCNPKYIALYLTKNYKDKFDIVWVFDENAEIPEDLPENIRVVRYFSIEYLKELHSAKFVVCNTRTGPGNFWHKRIEQKYIQTWHSSLRLKKIEGDASDGLSDRYIKNAKEDSSKIDLLISGCKFSTEIFRRALWYDGEIMECGTPRCDIFFNMTDELRKKVFDYYKIPYSTKLLLYAPTFRNNCKATTFGMDFKRISEALEKATGYKWVIGCRMHPNIKEQVKYENAVIMTEYSDMQELICAADILITDYSSCMFDMAFANKPCILYTPDLEDYIKNERGLYFDIKSLPFKTVGNMDELEKIITDFESEAYAKKIKEFMNNIGSFENGNAAKSVCDYLIKNLKK